MRALAEALYDARTSFRLLPLEKENGSGARVGKQFVRLLRQARRRDSTPCSQLNDTSKKGSRDSDGNNIRGLARVQRRVRIKRISKAATKYSRIKVGKLFISLAAVVSIFIELNKRFALF